LSGRSGRLAVPGALARICLGAWVVLALGGCSGTSTGEFGYPALRVTDSPVAPARTSGAVVAAQSQSPSPSPADTVAVSPTVTGVTVTSSAGDGSWQVTFQKPVVSGIPGAAAATINAAVGRIVNGWIGQFSTDAEAVTAKGQSSALNGTFSVALNSPTLLSLRFRATETIAGGAGPRTLVDAINFVPSTGRRIGLADLFTSGTAALPVLSEQARSRLAASLGPDLVWPSSPTLDSFGAFDLTVAGLELIWPQGTVAGQAAGTVGVTIPWSSLASVIDASGPAAEFMP
jgi:hypothetical protein